MRLSSSSRLGIVPLVTCFLLLALGAFAQVPAVTPAFPNNLTGTPGTLLFRQINLSRVTNIAYHNGLIYTHEVGAANPRRWRFTDINNPATLTNEATGWQVVGNFSDHGTHGHYKVGDWLGGQFAVNIRRQSTGVNVLQDMPGFSYVGPSQPGDRVTRMYYPWGVAFNWVEYDAVTGHGYLYRGNQQLADWPALAQHGVTGNSILLGNLMFITSDESNMGVLCYDISPVFASPPQQPQLLDKLSGPIGAYICSAWQNYLIFSRRDTSSVDIVDYSDPTNLQFVTSIDVRGHPAWDRGNGLGYIQCQDNFVFADRHKINMDTFQPVLELDEIGDNRPPGSVAGQLDTSQHLMPMGNLLVSGSYSVGGADGVGVWIHDPNPDRNPPYVGYHIPRPGQTNFPLGAPISLLIHENLESFTIINGETVILRRADQVTPLSCIVAFSYDDVLTITPNQYLEPDQTYVVEIVPGGIKDVAGNGIVGYSFTFSTGNSVAGGNASPQISSFSAAPSPTIPGSEVTLTAAATDADVGDLLEYRFTFGEGSAVREWSPLATASHVYASAGHYGVKVQVRDVRTGTPLSVVSQTGTISVVPAPPVNRPRKSSPIALNESTRRVWVVNPDNDSVSLINADTHTQLAEMNLNTLLSIPDSVDPRNVALDGSGHAWITCRDADRLVVLNEAGQVLQNISLPYGSAPMGVAITPNGAAALVTLESKGLLLRFNTSTYAQDGSRAVGPMPRAIAITANGERALVTRFISGEEYGQVYDVNVSAMTLTRTIPLFRDRGRDGSSSGRGVPNYLSSITISPDGLYAYYTAVKANTHRGTYFDQGQNTNDPLDPDNTIRAMVGRIDLVTNREPPNVDVDSYRIDVDNSESPTSIEFTPGGDYFFVTVQGNNHVAVYDDLLLRTQPTSAAVKTTKGRFATGLAPQGLVFDPVTSHLFSADFMGRSVTVHDMGPFLSFGNRTTDRVAIPTIITDKLAAQVLLGKRIFYQAADGSGLSTLPTMSLEGYISCASCHVDGQHDGMTWDFTQRGEGFRNTTDLRGRGGVGHGNVHWSGNFDEIQDFVLDVVNEFGGGQGLLPEGQAPHPAQGTPNAGRSANLDALAAYVTSLGGTHLVRSPYRNADGSRTAAADAGAVVFNNQSCAACHGNATRTDSTLGAVTLHNVGTLRTSSGERLFGPLDGIDTPSLLGLWAGAPYFHDGSAKTLDEVFSVAGGTIYQAESAVLSGGAGIPAYPRLNEDSAMHGQMVYLRTGDSVTFNNVQGGSGGLGDLELRWVAPYWTAPGTATVTVNGVAHQVTVIRPFGVGQPGDHWQRLRIENVNLTAGATNTLVVTTTSTDDSGFDDLTVTTANDRTAAAVHRGVLGLSETDRNNLREYLLQLDAEDSPNVNPLFTLMITPGQTNPTAAPYAEFDIVFAEPVEGLTIADFVTGGTAGATAGLVTTVTPGTHYRLRLAGFTQAGTITVQLPAARVTAVDDGAANLPSGVAVLNYLSGEQDDLVALSDEFGDAGSISGWQRLDQTEGWGANKLQTYDVNTSRSGHMRLTPVASGWYQDYAGPYAFRTVTGDFIATVRMDVSRRNGALGRPSSSYSVGGLMLRVPKAITHAGDVPGSDWQPVAENYVTFNFGSSDVQAQPNTQQWQCIVGSTQNSISTFYNIFSGVPVGENTITIQMVRMGSTIVLLRQHPGGQWIVQQRYSRIDFPATLQLGIMTVTDFVAVSGQSAFDHNRTVSAGGNPDVVVEVDYFRLRRPDITMTESALIALPFTGESEAVALLSNTTLSADLGTPLDQPYAGPGITYLDWLGANLTASQLVHPANTDPGGDANRNGVPNLVEFATGSSTSAPLTLQVTGTPGNLMAEVTLTRHTGVRGATLIVESTPNFVDWTTLATSVNGGVPTGPATITEGAGTVRWLNVATPAGPAPQFFRARVVAP